VRTSDDGGRSWSEKKYVGEETFQGDQWNSIRVNQLADGRIILVCDRISGTEFSSETELYAFESYDDGASFTEKRRLGIYGYCSDKVRELSDGSLLLCVSRFNSEMGKSEIFAHKSLDGGLTWSNPRLAASSTVYTFIEPAAYEMGDGTVAVFLRENSFKNYNGFAVLSKDGGNNFSRHIEIPVPGMHRPFVGRLENGKMLLSYREFLMGDKSRLKACVFDEGSFVSGEKFEIFEIDRDMSKTPDSGYSAWVQLDDGEVLMVNYIVDDAPKAYIRGYRIKFGG
jgi:sialidase-1